MKAPEVSKWDRHGRAVCTFRHYVNAFSHQPLRKVIGGLKIRLKTNTVQTES